MSEFFGDCIKNRRISRQKYFLRERTINVPGISFRSQFAKEKVTKLQVGNRVCGKSKKHIGKTGITLQVLKESRQHTYEDSEEQLEEEEDGTVVAHGRLWIGIRLATAVEPRHGATRVYWDTQGYVNTPANYASGFQMSRHCFEQIMYALAFSDNSQPGDPGMLLGLELVEGSARQNQKQYFREFGEGTAAVLRLVEQFKGTGRTVVGDSAFASLVFNEHVMK
ncbi:uncharacterized protein PITG_09904 [Phytophthora infestans T30-4]|uniref:Uncharacterized protein n=1 Tax=Phytophthora infestans (strain T30-4) TaxID=403677 RepID=D0NDT8_PHYIT|nr:uncharacterized protein PITG_09904 [Phytophthora infestans T30-4]EEY56383.1 hypothetical protein PITG_09904 [Phytophthora infestans T30-4]|eukprot:XP_002902457.1 hypothetical protein PITG_09904 [Phytophthora infestans T30-4]